MYLKQVIIWHAPGTTSLKEAADMVMGEFVEAREGGPTVESMQVWHATEGEEAR